MHRLEKSRSFFVNLFCIGIQECSYCLYIVRRNESGKRRVQITEDDVLDTHVNVGDTRSAQRFVELSVVTLFVIVDFLDIEKYLGLKSVERGEKPVCHDFAYSPDKPQAGTLFLHDAIPVFTVGETETLPQVLLYKLF